MSFKFSAKVKVFGHEFTAIPHPEIPSKIEYHHPASSPGLDIGVAINNAEASLEQFSAFKDLLGGSPHFEAGVFFLQDFLIDAKNKTMQVGIMFDFSKIPANKFFLQEYLKTDVFEVENIAIFLGISKSS